MKAVICSSFGPITDLSITEIEAEPLRSDQVRVKVAACGLNFPDTLLVQGKYQVKPPLPFSPGGEISGTISELGSDVKNWAVGDRVMATIFWGGLREEATVPQSSLVKIPEDMNMNVAAVFQGGHMTSYFALKQRAKLKSGETLLVLGAGGGVGMAAMQLGKAMGAKVIGAVGSKDKQQALNNEGFSEIIHYGEQDLRETIKSATNGQGIDVAYDPVGGDLFEPAARSLRPNGRILVVGFADGKIPSFPVNLTLLKQISIVGVNYQTFFNDDRAGVEENFSELFEMYQNKQIKPLIDKVFPLDRTVEAFKLMSERKVIGKAVVELQHD